MQKNQDIVEEGEDEKASSVHQAGGGVYEVGDLDHF